MLTSSVRGLVLVPVLLLAACGSDRRASRLPGGCTVNQSVACACAPGVMGVQVCQADHTFEPCRCEAVDGGPGSTDSGLPEVDSGVPEADGGRPEADGGLPIDGGVPGRDGGSPEDDAGFPDAGFADAGFPVEDAGFADAGFPDAGFPDAGFPDAGFPDAGFRDAGFPDSGVPLDAGFPDSGVPTDAGTPACTLDSQCASGRCHPLYNQCVPVGRKLHCETCASDGECGLAADHCLSVTIGGTPAETICAQGCNQDNDCPRGYECSLNNHCYPIPGSIRPHTCASVRDTLAQKACDPFLSTDQCGLATVDDGTCVLLVGCSIGCTSDVMCPSGTSCTNWFVGDFCTAP